MEIMEIIKDAFVFPTKDTRVLLIYIVLSVLAGAFSVMGTLIYVLGVLKPELFLWGGLAVVLSMIIGWIVYGYLVSVIKSGIDLDDEVPQFEWWDNFITGFYNFIVSIIYFIIPAFIVVIVGYLTNIFGNLMNVAIEIHSQAENVYWGGSTAIAYEAINQALVNLAISLTVTMTIAVIVFLIFSFLQTMAEARLANTGSLGEALNIFEAAKDITRIGISKVIILIVLVGIIVGIVQMILSAIAGAVPILSILSVIITPYLLFFTQRAVGLLYSDIA